jgi:CheY-like chemotaxis protein
MKESKAHILVVDDDETNRMVVQMLMEMRGHHVRQVSSGEECLKLINLHQFDLILMDLSMPKMDGFETVTKIKAMKGLNPDVIIYGLSAHTTQNDRERCELSGMMGLIPKPFDSDRANQVDAIVLSL